MTQMPTATTAMHFNSGRKEGTVYGCANRTFDWVKKARPTGAAVEFGFRGKEWQLARSTHISTIGILLIEWTGVSAFSPMFPQYIKLFLCQTFAPLFLGFSDFKLTI